MFTLNLRLFSAAVDQYRHLSPTPGSTYGVNRFGEILIKKYGMPRRSWARYHNENASQEQIEDGLRFYLPDEKRQLGSSDIIIIYFSGHGHVDGNGNYYFAPYDGKHFGICSLFPISLLKANYLSKFCARHILLILDTCGAASAGGVSTERWSK